MINCEKTKTIISAYIDNELNENDKLEIEKHIEICSSCKNEVHELQQIISLVAEFGDEDLPINFGVDFHNKLIQASKPEKKIRNAAMVRNRYIKICSTIAAGFLVCILLKDYFTGNLLDASKNATSTGRQNMVMNSEVSNSTDQKESATMDKKIAANNKSVADWGITADNSTVMADQTEVAKSSQEFNGYMAPEAGINSDTALKKDTESVMFNEEVIADSRRTITDMWPQTDSSVEKSQDSSLGEILDLYTTALAKESIAISSSLYGMNDKSQYKQIKDISISVMVNNTEESMALIKDYASKNNIVIYERYKAMEATLLQEDQSPNALGIKIIDLEYDKFIEFINNTFGASKIAYGPMYTINTIDNINRLNSQLNDLNIKIEQLRKKSNYNKLELNQMLMERDKLRIQLENSIMDAGYVLIEISLV